jgi:hypothetical protein
MVTCEFRIFGVMYILIWPAFVIGSSDRYLHERKGLCGEIRNRSHNIGH